MKMLLTSSGIKNSKIAKALEELGEKQMTDMNLLFVISASATEGGDKGWIINTLNEFRNLGFKSIDILDIGAVPNEVWQKRFSEKDVVCFCGGNEFFLADLFEKVGMKDYLLSDFENRIYMGISAGSMVVGHFMPNNAIKIIFKEEDFGLPNKPAMGILDICFIPHLNNDFFKFKKEDILAIKDMFTKTTYALDDNSALKIDGDKIEVVGGGEFLVIEK